MQILGPPDGFQWGCTAELLNRVGFMHGTFRSKDLKHLEGFGQHKQPTEQTHTQLKGKSVCSEKILQTDSFGGRIKRCFAALLVFFFSPPGCDFSLHNLETKEV